jgi:hypothetical protein
MRRGLTFDTVRKVGLALPGVEEGTAYSSPALKLHGDLLASIAINKSAESNTLAVRCGFEERDDLISYAPQIYYVTEPLP